MTTDPTIRSAGPGVALSDDAVVQIAREAAASSDPGHNLLCDAWRGAVRAGECDEDDPLVQGAILGARAAAAALSAGAGPGVVEALRAKANAARADAAALDRQANAPGGADPSVQRMAYAMGAKCDYYLDAARMVEEALAAPSPVAAGEAVPPVTFTADLPLPAVNLHEAYEREKAREAAPPAEPVAGLVERLKATVLYEGPTGEGYTLLNEAAAMLAALEAERKRLIAECESIKVERNRYAEVADAAEAGHDRLREDVERKDKALKAAAQFIGNGCELGFIRMPDFAGDPAHETLPMIEAALAPASEDQKGVV